MALLQAITHGFVQQSHTALRVLRKLRRLSWFSAALRSPPSGPLLAAAQPTLVGSLTSLRFRSVSLHCACQAHRTIPIHWPGFIGSTHYSYSQRSLHCRIGTATAIGPPPLSCAPPAGHPQLRACTLRLPGSRSADTAPLYLPYSLRSRFLHRCAVQLLFVLLQ